MEQGFFKLDNLKNKKKVGVIGRSMGIHFASFEASVF